MELPATTLRVIAAWWGWPFGFEFFTLSACFILLLLSPRQYPCGFAMSYLFKSSRISTTRAPQLFRRADHDLSHAFLRVGRALRLVGDAETFLRARKT